MDRKPIPEDEAARHWQATVDATRAMTPTELLGSLRCWLQQVEATLGSHDENAAVEAVARSMATAWCAIAHEEPGLWWWNTTHLADAGKRMLEALPEEERVAISLAASPPPPPPPREAEDATALDVVTTDHEDPNFESYLALTIAAARRVGVRERDRTKPAAQRIVDVLMFGALNYHDNIFDLPESANHRVGRAARAMRIEMAKRLPLGIDSASMSIDKKRRRLADYEDEDLVKVALLLLAKGNQKWDSIRTFAWSLGIGVSVEGLKAAAARNAELVGWMKSR